MKTYEQLTESEKKAAIAYFAAALLKDICEGSVRFNDTLNKDTLQKRIDKAIARAEKMQTPWFAHEYIMDTCREEIEGMASCTAEDAAYLEDREVAINIRSLAEYLPAKTA